MSVPETKPKKKMGGPRPGSGRPKGSINRISLPNRRKIADEFAKHSHKALNYYVRVLEGKDEEGNEKEYADSLKMQCADRILDRGIGKAVSQVELTGADGKDLLPEQTKQVVSQIDPRQLLAMKELLISLAKPSHPGDEAIIVDQSDD